LRIVTSFFNKKPFDLKRSQSIPFFNQTAFFLERDEKLKIIGALNKILPGQEG
jgi:hypothetical protein